MDFVALRTQIDQHPGKEILETLQAYSRSKDILALNGGQLRHIIQVLEDPTDPAGVRPLANRERLEGMFSSVLQHFHNFLCSVTTVIDHTRHVMHKGFVTDAHRSEYDKKVGAEFSTDPLARFMKEFRNYITHFAVPLTELEHHITRDSEVTYFNVDVEQMLNSGFRWTSPATQFMRQHRPKVRMLTLLNDYERKATTFHEGFVLEYDRHYRKPLSEVLKLMKAWNEGLQSGAKNRP